MGRLGARIPQTAKLLTALQMHNGLEVIGLREQVDQGKPLDSVSGKQFSEIARQGGWIATHER